jgi:hypothetical protein
MKLSYWCNCCLVLGKEPVLSLETLTWVWKETVCNELWLGGWANSALSECKSDASSEGQESWDGWKKGRGGRGKTRWNLGVFVQWAFAMSRAAERMLTTSAYSSRRPCFQIILVPQNLWKPHLCVRDLHCCLSCNCTSVVNYEIELLM